jgi:tetratricopeptide (TPR) repeat protein
MAKEKQDPDKNLKVAYSYIDDSFDLLDSVNDLRELEENEDQVLDVLNNLKSSKKRIEEVEKQDPDFETTTENSDGEFIDISTDLLRNLLFYLEGSYRLGLGEKKRAIRLLNQCLSLSYETKLNDSEIKARIYGKLSIAYRWIGNKAKCIEMIEKAKEVNTDEALEIEIEKELDEQKSNPAIFFKIFAFQGSWVILLVLVVMTLGGIFTLSSSPAGSIISIPFFGGLSYLYWWWNTRY